MGIKVVQWPFAFRSYDEPDDGRPVWNPYDNGISTVMWSYVCGIVGLREIREDNLETFYVRISFYEKLYGALLQKWDEGDEKPTPRPVTMDDLKQFVGLIIGDRHAPVADTVPDREYVRNDDYWYDIEDRTEDMSYRAKFELVRDDQFPVDEEQGAQLLPVEPAYGSDADFMQRMFESYKREKLYRLRHPERFQVETPA